jgi:hypothetical protein
MIRRFMSELKKSTIYRSISEFKKKKDAKIYE